MRGFPGSGGKAEKSIGVDVWGLDPYRSTY